MTREELKAAIDAAIPADLSDFDKEKISDAIWVIVDAREVEWQQKLDLAQIGGTADTAAPDAPVWQEDGSFSRPAPRPRDDGDEDNRPLE